jgi:hypothetical protein
MLLRLGSVRILAQSFSSATGRFWASRRYENTCVFERRYRVRAAKDRGGIIGEIDFQCRPHLFPLVTGDRILHQGDVVSEFCGVTHRRVEQVFDFWPITINLCRGIRP